MNGVIDKLTGILKRAGFCDFAHDGSFNPLTEELRSDVPEPALAYTAAGPYHQLVGSAWQVVNEVPNTLTVDIVRIGRQTRENKISEATAYLVNTIGQGPTIALSRNLGETVSAYERGDTELLIGSIEADTTIADTVKNRLIEILQ